MNNPQLGERLKAIRKTKGYSQEALAEESKVSLKTIQRIENAKNDPTGDTIQRISSALNISPDELLDWKIVEDKSYLQAVNTSAFTFVIFPILGILLPAIMWFAKKDKIRDLNTLAKSLLNFQITWNILLLVGIIVYQFLMRYRIDTIQEITLYSFNPYYQYIKYFLISMNAFNFIMISFNLLKIRNGKNAFYWPHIKFIK